MSASERQNASGSTPVPGVISSLTKSFRHFATPRPLISTLPLIVSSRVRSLLQGHRIIIGLGGCVEASRLLGSASTADARYDPVP